MGLGRCVAAIEWRRREGVLGKCNGCANVLAVAR